MVPLGIVIYKHQKTWINENSSEIFLFQKLSNAYHLSVILFQLYEQLCCTAKFQASAFKKDHHISKEMTFYVDFQNVKARYKMQILCLAFTFSFFFLPSRYVYCERCTKAVFLDKSKSHDNCSYVCTGDWDKVLSLFSVTLLSCSPQTQQLSRVSTRLPYNLECSHWQVLTNFVVAALFTPV